MTVDLSPINAATEAVAWPMPHIDSEIYEFMDSSVFATMDFVSGYWQLPLEQELQEYHSIVTPKGIYSPKRTQQGGKNSVANFQSQVEPLFRDIRENLKAWLDAFVVHCRDERSLLSLLERFLLICRSHRLYLSARKCVFFTETVRWCGRLISKDGIKMDPTRVLALRDLDTPRTAGELSQFVHCLRWMSNSIPQFSERSAILNDVLEKAYKRTGRRTKRSVPNISLDTLSWGKDHLEALKSLQDTIRDSVQLSFPKKDKRICIYTYASDKFWSAVVTQIAPSDMHKPIEEQAQEPLAFLRAAFKDAEKNWSTFEQEGFAIYQSLKKLDYLFYHEHPIHVFTDHRNLLFLFAPLALEPALERHVVNKVQRWALYLSQLPYLIEHVDGEHNIFADILTRWLRGYRSERKTLCKICKLAKIEGIVDSPAKLEFVWPSMDTIRQSQQHHQPRTERGAVSWNKKQKLWMKEDCIWIPEGDSALHMKVIVISHCGIGGHRGNSATESTIRENFHWGSLHEDVSEFVQSCIHCIITRTGEVVPRPLGPALHEKKPNEVVHIDFLYMGPGLDNLKYVLVVKDDLSGFYGFVLRVTQLHTLRLMSFHSGWPPLGRLYGWSVIKDLTFPMNFKQK